MCAQTLCIGAILLENGLDVDGLTAVNTGDDLVLACAGCTHDVFKTVGIDEIVHAHADALSLVHVGGTDALLGGTDIVTAASLFGQGIQFEVPGQDAVAACVDEQLVCLDALFCQTVDLTQNIARVYDDARADDVDAVGVEDTRGNELQFVLFTINNDRMTGVVASLAAHHKIGVCRKDVDEFAFAFVAPLSA